jgi:hypothetical protein
VLLEDPEGSLAVLLAVLLVELRAAVLPGAARVVPKSKKSTKVESGGPIPPKKIATQTTPPTSPPSCPLSRPSSFLAFLFFPVICTLIHLAFIVRYQPKHPASVASALLYRETQIETWISVFFPLNLHRLKPEQ